MHVLVRHFVGAYGKASQRSLQGLARIALVRALVRVGRVKVYYIYAQNKKCMWINESVKTTKNYKLLHV